MKERNILINYRAFSSVEELEPADKKLVEAAKEAMKTSYAPYSRFNVGAAVLLGDGTVVKGSNQENAASPSGLCAERTALFAASAGHPGVPVRAIAIAGGPEFSICKAPVTPCGACRQVMAEYQRLSGGNMSVIMAGEDEIWKFDKVDDIMPFIFDSL